MPSTLRQDGLAEPPTQPGDPAGAPAEGAGDAREGLIHRSATEIGALLVGCALLRVGAAGAGQAVQLDLVDLGGGRAGHITVGIVGAAQAVPEMLLAFGLARLADRFGRRRFLIGGPLLGMLAVLLLAGAVHPLQIGVARLVEGVGAAAFVPTALGTIAAATSSDRAVRARASGAFEGATLFGYAGGFLVGPLFYHGLGRGCFLVLAGFYLAAALVCLRFVPRIPPLPVSPVGVIWRAITGPGPIRVFIPAWLAVNTLVGGWYFNLASLLRQTRDPSQTLVHGFDDRIISGILLGWVVLLLLGIVLWTPVLRRRGGPATMLRAVPGVYLIGAGALLTNHLPLGWAPWLLPIAGAGIIMIAGFGPAAVAYLADCSETLAADRSALMAFYTITLAGGGALGSVLGGLFAKWLLLDGLVLLGVLCGSVALVSLRRVVRSERGPG
ncbi:MAG TPA: MFS transporter [Candidatus Dormibacteraeota bacterium]|nr:MFS transporter [Candidatus Dormibacteraeota bacterium]